jgi:hypothetical protein
LSSRADATEAWPKPCGAYIVAGCADEWSAFATELVRQLNDTA